VDVLRAAKDPVARLTVQGPPSVIAFNHAGTRLAVTGGPEGEPRVDVFELPSGKQLLAFAPPGTRTTTLLFHPDGRLVVANSRTVYVHPPDSHAPELELGGHKGQINALAVSPDGKRLLSASHDGAIRAWDAASGAEVRAFDWKIGPVTALAFAPDGLTCAAAGKGGQVVLWDADG
jgi:WD40 repeat protein